MSTRQQPTYDDTTKTSPRIDNATTNFSPCSAETTASDAQTPHGDVPWTERCKRQFDTTDAMRMRNLNDDTNAAMHDRV